MAAPTQNERYKYTEDFITRQNQANQENLSDMKRTVEEVHRSRIEDLEVLNKKRISLEKAEECHLSAHLKKQDDLLDKESSAFQKRLQGEVQKQSQTQEEFSSYLEKRQARHESDLAAKKLLLEEKRRKLETFRADSSHERRSDEEKIDCPGRKGLFQEKKDQEMLGESKMQSEDSMTDERLMIAESGENTQLLQDLEENHEPAKEVFHSLDDDLPHSSKNYQDMHEARLAKARERLEGQKQKVKIFKQKI